MVFFGILINAPSFEKAVFNEDKLSFFDVILLK